MRLLQPTPIGANGSLSFTVEKPTSALIVEFAYANTAISDRRSSVNLTSNGTLDMNLTTKNGGQHKLARKVPLSAVLEYDTFGEGIATVTRDLSDVTRHRVQKVRFRIPLTIDGKALSMQNDETLNITIDGLLSDGNLTVTCWGEESLDLTYAAIVWDSMQIGSNLLNADFDARHLEYVLVPNSESSVQYFQLEYSNKKVLLPTFQELFVKHCDNNDTFAQNTDNLALSVQYPPCDQWVVLPVSHMTRFSVEKQTTSLVYTMWGISQKVVFDVATVIGSVVPTKDTAAAKLDADAALNVSNGVK